MLKMENVKKSYHKLLVLDGLTMHVSSGALFGFVGPNGAGKTTAIKIMTGLIRPDSGRVLLDQVNIAENDQRLKNEMGYVPDYFGVYDNLKVTEYMEFFASCYGFDGLQARKKYNLLLDQVGLDEKKDAYVDSLSRGMKQRLSLARALIHDPALLIMDEPSSGLDPATRVEVKQILLELCEQGKTIILSSHVLSELSEICTDIGIIEQGKMVMGGNKNELLSQIYTSNPLRIAVYEEIPKAVELLRQHPFVQTLSVSGDEIQIMFDGEKEDEVMLLYQLMEAGISVYRFFRETSNLESLFMQITKQEEAKVVLAHEN